MIYAQRREKHILEYKIAVGFSLSGSNQQDKLVSILKNSEVLKLCRHRCLYWVIQMHEHARIYFDYLYINLYKSQCNLLDEVAQPYDRKQMCLQMDT